MSASWTPIEDMRRSAGVTEDRLAKGPRWANEYIERLEREVREVRAAHDALAWRTGARYYSAWRRRKS